MNTSPVITGAAAVTAAQLGGLVSYAVSAAHLAPLPADVAGTIGALLFVAAHIVYARFLAPKAAA